MASRFASISDEEVKEFTEKLENENTKKKTLYDIKVFKEYLDACDEKREIEDITPVELQEIIKKFVLAVRKKNGEEYEPSSLRAFIQSIDRHLRKNNYGFSVLNDKEFHEVQDILKKKQKQLKSIGKGNRPNAADPLSDEDIDTFYSRKVLGIHSPRALLNTLWMNNCTFFGMRPGKEQRDLCWGDLQLKTDSEGNCFIEFNIERQTKTRTGENPRNIREKKPKMYEDKSNADRCPVNTYLAYKEHRPTSMMTDESPFYLAVNNENPKPGQMWFKCSPLGVNSLRSMLKNMIRDSGLETDKKLVNHSTRKHLVQKLVDNDIPPNEIIQITGHKKVNSLNNYSSLSDKKQQQISAVLSNAASTSQSLSAVSIEENTKAESFLSGATSGSLFQNCQIATVNVQVYQSGRTEKSSKIRCEKKLKITVSDDSSQSQ